MSPWFFFFLPFQCLSCMLVFLLMKSIAVAVHCCGLNGALTFFLFCFFVCWSCLSNHAVLLVAVFLHKFPFRPYQRGFFCNDNSIGLTYKRSTVSTTMLTAVGATVPVVSVSPAVVLQDNERTSVGGHSVHPMVFLWRLKTHNGFDSQSVGVCTLLAANHADRITASHFPTVTVHYLKLSEGFPAAALHLFTVNVIYREKIPKSCQVVL